MGTIWLADRKTQQEMNSQKIELVLPCFLEGSSSFYLSKPPCFEIPSFPQTSLSKKENLRGVFHFFFSLPFLVLSTTVINLAHVQIGNELLSVRFLHHVNYDIPREAAEK